MLANAVQVFKKQTHPPNFAIFSRLDKQLLKALLIKCTELEDYELDDLRDVYFNPERAEREGQFNQFGAATLDDLLNDNSDSHVSTARELKGGKKDGRAAGGGKKKGATNKVKGDKKK